MKVFLDTNVLVSAFAARGICEDVLRIVLAEHQLVVAESVLTELERVLTQKLRMPRTKAAAVVAFVRSQADVRHPKEPAAWPKTDRDDQWIVAAAIDGGADFLVTGDRDLLDVAAEVSVTIVSPREFWERLR